MAVVGVHADVSCESIAHGKNIKIIACNDAFPLLNAALR